MLISEGHAGRLMKAVIEGSKTPPESTTPDTVIQFLCKDGEVVTTDKAVLMWFSPSIRSVICSVPSSSCLVISLPDISSSGVRKALTFLSHRWSGEVYMLTHLELDVLVCLGIPVGPVERVKVLDFDVNEVQDDHLIRDLVAEKDGDDVVNGNLIKYNIKCPECDHNCGPVNENSKDELLIHVGEIHGEPELLAEFKRAFVTGSNSCGYCGVDLCGEYVQQEHILLKHPWPMLKGTVEEVFEAALHVEKSNVKKGESEPLIKVNNVFSKKELPIIEEKGKKTKRGRKRKNELGDSECSESPLHFPLYVPQRKSAKKASISISKSFEGLKKYKQQDIGLFMKRDKTSKESDGGGNEFETKVDARELMEDIEMLLKDTDDEDEKLGLDITYEHNSSSDILDIQENIEFSDSDGEWGDVKAVYSMKVESGSDIDAGTDLLQIQHGIAFSDSDEEQSE